VKGFRSVVGQAMRCIEQVLAVIFSHFNSLKWSDVPAKASGFSGCSCLHQTHP
jgi:hypothetical protein